MTRNVEAIAEAFCSAANLGAGFDVFGLALNRYSDRVRVRAISGRAIRIFVKGRYGSGLPRDPKKNSAGPPAKALLRKAGSKIGLEITIEKNVPHGLGLGSSGATAAACTKALDSLLDLKLSNNELVRVASLGEKAITGTAHADNVGASLLGGFVVVCGNPFRAISIKPPTSLLSVVVSPHLNVQEGKTRHARKLIPKSIEVKKAVLNIGRASAIAVGFARGDIEMIGCGMEDEIAEPYRESLIPGYRDVKNAALAAKAAGVSISGAGPSIIALVDRALHDPQRVAKAMVQAFTRRNVQSTFFVAQAASGARIVRRK